MKLRRHGLHTLPQKIIMILTRDKAWREARKAFKGFGTQWVHERLRRWGLCGAVTTLWLFDLITHDTHVRMVRDIQRARPKGVTTAYYWPVSDKQARVKAITKILNEHKRQTRSRRNR